MLKLREQEGWRKIDVKWRRHMPKERDQFTGRGGGDGRSERDKGSANFSKGLRRDAERDRAGSPRK